MGINENYRERLSWAVVAGGGGVVLDRKKERQESPLICYCLQVLENAGMSHDDVTGLPFASKIKPYNNPNTTSTTTDATTTTLYYNGYNSANQYYDNTTTTTTHRF